MNRIAMIIVTLLVLLFVGSTMIFTVDQRQIGVVYAFGKVRYIINVSSDLNALWDVKSLSADRSSDGEIEFINKPGLHFKLPAPFQTIAYIDKRIQTLDNATPVEILTSESNMGLIVDWFVKWRVVDAKRFIESNNGTDMRTAEAKLVSNVQRIFNEEVARRSVQAVLDSDRQRIMSAVQVGLAPIAQDMGILIEDVRVRRVDYSASTAPKIFEQMITERKSLAEKLRAEGNAENENLRAQADRTYQEKIATAYQEAQNVMGEGDAQATRTFADAFGKDPQFADFYRSLQAYRASFLGKDDVMVLDPNSEFFKFMGASQTGGR